MRFIALGLCGLLTTTVACNSSVTEFGGAQGPPEDEMGDGGFGPSGDPATRIVRVQLGYAGIDNDLDMTIYEPGGAAIDFYNPTPGSGAKWAETETSETVVWESGKAPAGEYEVFVTPYYVNGKLLFTVTIEVDDDTFKELTGYAYEHQELAFRVGSFSL